MEEEKREEPGVEERRAEAEFVPANVDTGHESEEDFAVMSDSTLSTLDSPLSNRESLIADGVDDELQGSLQFIDRYQQRYGEPGPRFFAGTLKSALNEAFSKPTAERKLLALYLHHTSSLSANIFCTELLGYAAMLELLRENFVVWGWDVSHPKNKTLFLESCSSNLGKLAERTLDMESDHLPALVVVSRVRAGTEIRRVIHGSTGLEESLERITESVEEFRNLMDEELAEEKERAARERLKSQQDEDYRESLEIDRAKAENKRRKMEQKSQEERVAKQLEEERRRRLEEERQRLEANLPTEPVDKEGLVSFLFRPPGDQPFQRKFQLSSRLQEVLDFLTVRGFRSEEYRLLAGWPRQDLSIFSPQTSIRDLPLNQQETIILQPR